MKKIVRNCLLFTTFIFTGLLSSYSSAFAEGHTLKITEPEDVWLRFNEEKVASYSIGLHVPADGSVTADLKFRGHCPEDYVVSSVTVYDAIDNRDIYKSPGGRISDHNRTEYLTFEGLKVSTIVDLKARCSTVAGGGTYGINLPIKAELSCFDNSFQLDPFRNNYIDNDYYLDLPIKVTCGLTMVNATVEDEFWSYLCPKTPRDDEAFWQKYRLVVEGTDSNQVRTNVSLGEPQCVNISQSNGSNMSKVIWKAE